MAGSRARDEHEPGEVGHERAVLVEDAGVDPDRAPVGLGPPRAPLEDLGLGEQRVAVDDGRRRMRQLLRGEVRDRLARDVRDGHPEGQGVDERSGHHVAPLLGAGGVDVVDVQRVVVHGQEAEEVVVGLRRGLGRPVAVDVADLELLEVAPVGAGAGGLALARVRAEGAAHGSADPGGPGYTVRAAMRSPRDFFEPLCAGAPAPLREIPFPPSRMVHFFDPSNEKVVARLPETAARADIVLGNLEDAVPVDRKEAARAGLVRVGREVDLGRAQLWTRVNALDSPWALDDLTSLVAQIGRRLDVVMVPKVQGPWDIHYVDRLLAQLEARAGLDRPILVHALIETAGGVAHVEEIAAASPRMQGMSLGPADLAASRRMRTTRVGGGHPGYLVIADPDPRGPDAPRPTAQQDLWHYSLGRIVDACAAHGLLPFYGPFGDIEDVAGCEAQFRAASVMGCVGAWSLHPVQIDIARRVFSPDPAEVRFARRVIEAIPDGRGVHVIDGRMQDDATVKQCQVVVGLARMLAERDPELRAEYGL